MKLIWLNEKGEVRHVRPTEPYELAPDGSHPAMFTYSNMLPNLCKLGGDELIDDEGEMALLLKRIRQAMHTTGRIEIVE